MSRSLIFLLFVFYTILLPAQVPPCHFDHAHQALLQSDPHYRESEKRINQHWQNLQNSSTESSFAPVTIPVVVHIVSPPGTAVGQGNNITEAQVELGIELLNEIFANSGRYTNPDGVNTEISFCLARRTQEGLPTNGIVRIESDLVNEAQCAPGTNQTSDRPIKALSAWDCSQYMNVWLVTDLFSGANGCGLAGFAYFPGAGCALDGIVQESRYWYTERGAAVSAHEVGHYLGLYHTFQGGCANNDCLTQGDRICDTPPDASPSFAPCGTNSCSTDNPDLPDDTENIMDYSNCRPIRFSRNQAERMQAVLNDQRSSLIQSEACLPVVDLDAAVVDLVFPNGNCSDSLCVEVHFRNIGNDILTTANFRMRINGGMWVTRPWNGNLFLGESDRMIFPCQVVTAGNYRIEVELIDPNGQMDEYFANNRREETLDIVSILRTSIDYVTPARCQSNGEVQLQSNGGVPPYEYSLEAGRPPQGSDFFNFLTKGDYTITVTDQIGCSSTIAVNIPDSCAKDAPRDFVLNGSAVYNGNTCYALVPDRRSSVGSIWYEDFIGLDEDFVVSFEMNLGCRDNFGADGLAFVFQPISTSLGVSGGGLGFEGINPSLAIEFDTWENNDRDDPPYDHLAIMGDGNIAHNNPLNLAGPVGIIPGRGNVEDCDWRNVVIQWDEGEKELSVYVDCDLRLSLNVDMVDRFFDGDPNVYFGFTAATGLYTNLHQVCVNYVNAVDKIKDDIICQGDRIERSAPSVFSSYEWSPSKGINDPTIFNPIFSPDTTTTYVVRMEDQCFTIRDTFTIEVVDLAIDSIMIQTDTCGDREYQVEVMVLPDSDELEYSIDGIQYVSEPTFDLPPGQHTIYVRRGSCRQNRIIDLEEIPDLKDSLIFQSPETCLQLGSIILQGMGGLMPYRYELQNGQTNGDGIFNDLSSGMYTYIIRDARGCEITGQVVIADFTQNINLLIDSSDLRIDCCDSATWIQVSNPLSVLNTYYLDGNRQNTNGRFDNISPGRHFITVEGESDCPSDTIFFEVLEYRSAFNSIDVQICEGQDTMIHQVRYAEEGVYYDTIDIAFCCDSILEINVNVDPLGKTDQDFLLCAGEFVEVGNNRYSAPGTYVDTLPRPNNCDSIVITKIEAAPHYEIPQSFQFCPQPTYDIGYREVTSAGRYVDTLKTARGCDSVIITEVTVFERDSTTIEEEGCRGLEVKIGNQSFFETGLYQVLLQNQNGCDSLVFLDLTIYPLFQSIQTQRLCPEDTIMILGKSLFEEGRYEFNLQSQSGCDSTILIDVVAENGGVCNDRVKVWAPNVFSPNGDRINDRFNVFGNDRVKRVVEMNIFSRWGELLWTGLDFASSTDSEGWDGRFQGEEMLPGVYTFIVEVELVGGQRRDLWGTVTLVR